MNHKTLIALGVVLAAAVGAYLVQKTYGKTGMEMDIGSGTPRSTTYPVAAAPVEMGSFAGTITYTGTVAAYAEEDIYPRVMGRIVEMRVYPGDHVAAGQIVARLDDVELSSRVRENLSSVAANEANLAQMDADVIAAQHNVVQMQKELAMAEADFGYQKSVADRDEKLLARGAIAQQEAENSRAMVAAARAKVEAAHSKIDQARAMEASVLKKKESMAAMASQSQAMLRTAEVVRDYVNIRTAMGGHVVKRLIAPGTLVQPGMAILKIVQIDRVRFQANVSDRDVARLRVGTPVRVRVSGQEDRPLNLRVSSVFPFAEGAARTATVEAVAANPGSRFLPGHYASMEFDVDGMDSALTVPRPALVQNNGSNAVWVVADGSASSRGVTAGAANAERVTILKGLRPGEQVVVRGQEMLFEGAKVTVDVEPQAPAVQAPGMKQLPKKGAKTGEPSEMQDMAGLGTGTQMAQAPTKSQEAGTVRVHLTTIPATLHAGNARLRIQVKDGTGAPVSGAKVEALASMAGMATLKVAARAAKEPGIYEAAANLGMSGAWEVNVTVMHPRGGTTSAKFNLEVK